jgi:hypothetical protein
MGATTNYSLPTYDANDAPNLTGAYNSAIASIDRIMKSNETAASTAGSKAQNAQQDVDALETRVTALETKGSDFQPADDDMVLTVEQLSQAKVTKNGIVYFKAAS